MPKKKIGLLFGMEDTFPWALIEAINAKGNGEVEASAVEMSFVMDDGMFDYAVVLDRISHEIPLYRTWVKAAVMSGVRVINNPIWWSADDKFIDNLIAKAFGVEVPRTVLLPHKHHPPNTEPKSFRNMQLVNWDEVFSYLGFPIFMKPANGGGWKDVYKCNDPGEFFSAYDQTRDLLMMAQEAIDFEDYYRCFVIGRSKVLVMRYDPRQPHHLRYVTQPPDPKLKARIVKDALTLCQALGYDMNTVELAVRDGVPYAIDFMNCAPDADRNSVGEANFAWIVSNMAEVLIDLAKKPVKYEASGSWPQKMLNA